MRKVRVYVYCPRCGKLVKEYDEEYSVLCEYAYKHVCGKTYVTYYDSRGCCD